MLDAEDLLMDNLKDGLRSAQRFMIISLICATIVLALAWRQDDLVPIDGLPISISADRTTAAHIFGGGFFVFATMAGLVIEQSQKAVHALKDKRGIKAFILTFPSVPTLAAHGPRFALAIAPAVMIVISLIKFNGAAILDPWTMLGAFLLVCPQLFLAWQLRKAVGSDLIQQALRKSASTEDQDDGSTAA